MIAGSINTKQVHREAMQIAQQAFVAKQNGNGEQAMALYEQAFDLEKSAALSLLYSEDKEPTRSILFRSAAALAKSSNNYREAERMVSYGLSGNPPAEVADDLRVLYDELNFDRHINLKGLELDETEISLSLSGNEVGYGVIRSNEFLNRLQVIEQLTYRTAERKSGKPFRTSGSTPQKIKIQFEPFIATPIAASFAVKIKFGKPSNQLPIFDEKSIYGEIINEVITGIELANSSQEEELKAKIGNSDYYENFISLAKAIAPDGNNVKQVGLSVFTNNNEHSIRTIAIRKPKAKYTSDFIEISKAKQQLITVSGTLRMADADTGKIRLVNEDGKTHYITVPNGLTDIVRLYWEDKVTLTISKTAKKSRLVDIDKMQ